MSADSTPRAVAHRASPPELQHDFAEAPAVEIERAMGMVWPSGRVASLVAKVALIAGLCIPLSSISVSVSALAWAVPAVVLATILARLAFEGLSALREGAAGRAAAATVAALLGSAIVYGGGAATGRPPGAAETGVGVITTVAVLMAALLARQSELRRQAARRRVLFVGGVEQVDDFAREVGHSRNLKLAGSEWLGGERAQPLDRERLLSRVAEVDANTIVLSERALADRSLADAAASSLNLGGLRVRSLAGFYEEEFGKVAISELSSSWFLFDVAEIHGLGYHAAKRVLETLTAIGLLLAAAPLMPLIALAIKRSSPGPVLFRNQRVGKDGRVITLVKFRTMEEDPQPQAGWAAASQMRVFPVGARLRKFRLDELPQLWNVVRGDLSIVGPRPEQPAIVERLEQEIPFYGKRHAVRPGLTGWAQVNFGYGGSESGTLTKLQYDLYYLKHQSLRLDWRILLATVRTVIGGTGH